MKLKVLVVDDTIVYRKILSDVLADFPSVEVVGTASNGKIALSRIESLKPDLITLDVEMPVMDGVQTLEEIHKMKLGIGVIMVSTLTKKGSEITMKALELGAFDFVTKPDSESREENIKQIRASLAPRINHFLKRFELKKALKGDRAQKKEEKPREPREPRPAPPSRTPGRSTYEKSDIVAIGISTGGPNALTKMLPMLPGNLGVPVAIVQHMPPLFTKSLAESLNQKCALEVKEVQDGETVRKNVVYIAPGGKQTKIVAGANQARIFRVTDDPPENNCKPSVDYLFRSVAREYKSKVTGVIMTGMGNDGTLGLKVMKSFGAVTMGQDADTCVVYGMPKIAWDAGVVDMEFPLEKIAAEITSTVKR
ncbi:response regulator receiver modulated CheB methylesterase [Desulfonatronospira thiodismutans ASO3-1]|uniref:Protein-glutamate methylesterase/protein-glutamine glutaminase n=1 Tax=Desulfonatronospira thiodismutans ASO3-1 TaxID=555779 RepID=D6SLQ3_9BACT|nr:chemotaxis response regulator protein-glutamate methylesterase [Desulfonatronospira thiodismutans]EFI35614.1 response regulator receiver modulated CheB methylesterase [Desulfonatronospira thiodismutans ASO3-1]